MPIRKWFFVFVLLLVIGAGFSLARRADFLTGPLTPLRIGINPWPGYEFLYLADHKGYFEEAGLKVQIEQFSSLEDVRLAFEHGQVDAMCSTITEMLQAYANTGKQGKIALVTDFSAGADIIVARKPIHSVTGLKGKKIGVEPLSLGAVLLERALQKNGLGIHDVQVMNFNVLEMSRAIDEKAIDAAVTYPPMSLALQKRPDIVKIFDTTDIPGEIVDIVSVDARALERVPDFIPALRRVWNRAVLYAQENEAEAYGLMAAREGISVTEFKNVLTGIRILTADEQRELLKENGKVESSITLTQKTLLSAGALQRTVTDTREFIFRE